MIKSSWAAIAAAVLVGGSVAQAQVAPKSGPASIFTLTPAQQKALFPAIEKLLPVRTVKRGKTVSPLPEAAQEIAPTFSSGGKTYTVDEYMRAFNVSGLLVLKDGKILLERYGLGRKPQDRWLSFSVTKSLTSTLVGAAIKDGYIKSLDDLVTRYIPELRGSAYDGVTVRQLLTMSSGVKWNEDYSDPTSDVFRATIGAFEPGVNPTVAYMKRLPREDQPGAKFVYKTGEADLVGILVSKATGKRLSDYASEKIWKPAGMERDALWPVDLGGHERGGCCLSMTLRDYARFGQYVLDARAGREPFVSSAFARAATTTQITNGAPAPGYGHLWWMRPQGYAAEGIFGQSILTYPDDRLVVVFNSVWSEPDAEAFWAAQDAFADAARVAALHR